MTEVPWLLDTHVVVDWHAQKGIPRRLIQSIDRKASHGSVWISSISFWEIALLKKRGRIAIRNVETWMTELLSNSGARLLEATAADYMQSVDLPDYHRDPFDRVLVAQANRLNATLVTADETIPSYPVRVMAVAA